jgi:hypothetical protein
MYKNNRNVSNIKMDKLTSYSSFIKESYDLLIKPSDKEYMNKILMMPLEKRKELVESLSHKEKLAESVINESFIDNIEYRFKAWLTTKVLAWLINLSEKELDKKIKTLNLFDPTDFSKIRKVETIYLGGGIDKTPDDYEVILLPEEIGELKDIPYGYQESPKAYKSVWNLVATRNGIFLKIIEEIQKHCPDKLKDMRREPEPMDQKAHPLGFFTFSVQRGTDLSFLGPELLKHLKVIGGGGNWRFDIENMFGQEHVMQSKDIFDLSYSKKPLIGKFIGNYAKPIILNPLRKEQSTRDNPEFRATYAKWRRGELNITKDDTAFKFMADIINKDIKAPDLRVLNACDSNIVKYDAVAGDGTKGELQFGALKQGHNLFIWLDGGYDIVDVSPWTFPEATKIVRNREELDLLIASIKRINGIA